VPRSFIIAAVRDEQSLLRAVRKLRAQKVRIYDVCTPYPVHELGEALGSRASRLPWITLFAGVSGLVLALGFQFYAAILDWPMNVGGKPDNSTLAFIPITFELTVLFAGLCTVAAFLVRTGLLPPSRKFVPAEVSEDRFAIVLRAPVFEGRGETRELLASLGADEIYEAEGPQ